MKDLYIKNEMKVGKGVDRYTPERIELVTLITTLYSLVLFSFPSDSTSTCTLPTQ